jgi:pimeloyl-ACP methyl ester carboxylesterase
MATKKLMKILLIMLTLIGLASFLSLPAVAVPKWPIPDGIKTIEVNGYDMAYREVGSGIPLVLIHGSLVDYRTWETQVSEFSKAYRTIAVSLRHHYPEKWNGVGDDFSVAQHASDVAALIKKMNLGKVHLLGHSRGGPIALTVASLYPELIRTLILEDANMESLMPETPEKQKRMADTKARGDSVRANLAAGEPEKAAQEWLDSYGGAGTWEKIPAKWKQIIIDNIGTATDSGERGEVSCADIQKFSFPILLLNGERSPKLYGEMITVLRQCKPDIPAPLIVPKGTHAMHNANPVFFSEAVLEFLSSTTAGERIEYRAKHCNVSTKFEAVEVGDEPGHVIAVTEAKGIGVRIEGAPGGPYKLDIKGTGDYRSDHTGTNKGYGKATYPDGSFYYFKWSDGTVKAGHAYGTSVYFGGTGRFKGMTGGEKFDCILLGDRFVCDVDAWMELP